MCGDRGLNASERPDCRRSNSVEAAIPVACTCACVSLADVTTLAAFEPARVRTSAGQFANQIRHASSIIPFFHQMTVRWWVVDTLSEIGNFLIRGNSLPHRETDGEPGALA